MFENKNMGFLKCEIPVSGYVEAIWGRRQKLQKEKDAFTDILQNVLEKNFKSTNNSSVSDC